MKPEHDVQATKLIKAVMQAGYLAEGEKKRISDFFLQLALDAPAQEEFRSRFLAKVRNNRTLTTQLAELLKPGSQVSGAERAAARLAPPAADVPTPQRPVAHQPMRPTPSVVKKTVLPRSFLVVEGVKKQQVNHVRLALEKNLPVQHESVYWAFVGESREIKELILQKLPIDVEVSKGTALIWAILEGNLGAVRGLLDRGADLNLRVNKRNGDLYPLKIAAERAFNNAHKISRSNKLIFEELLKRGAVPNQEVAMIVAASSTFDEKIWAQLVQNGLRLSDQIDSKTLTTLAVHLVSSMQVAAASGYAQWLLEQGFERLVRAIAVELEIKSSGGGVLFLKKFEEMLLKRAENLTDLASYYYEAKALDRNLQMNYNYGCYLIFHPYCNAIKAIKKTCRDIFDSYIEKVGAPLAHSFMAATAHNVSWKTKDLKKGFASEELDIFERLKQRQFLPSSFRWDNAWIEARINGKIGQIIKTDFSDDTIRDLDSLEARVRSYRNQRWFFSFNRDEILEEIFVTHVAKYESDLPTLIEYYSRFLEVISFSSRNRLEDLLSERVRELPKPGGVCTHSLLDAQNMINILRKYLGSKYYKYWKKNTIDEAVEQWLLYLSIDNIIKERLREIEEQNDFPGLSTLSNELAELYKINGSLTQGQRFTIRKEAFPRLVRMYRDELRLLAKGQESVLSSTSNKNILRFFEFCSEDARSTDLTSVLMIFKEEFSMLSSHEPMTKEEIQTQYQSILYGIDELKRQKIISQHVVEKDIKEALIIFWQEYLLSLLENPSRIEITQLTHLIENMARGITIASAMKKNLFVPYFMDLATKSIKYYLENHPNMTFADIDYFYSRAGSLLKYADRKAISTTLIAQTKHLGISQLEWFYPQEYYDEGFRKGVGECPACGEGGVKLMKCPSGNEKCTDVMCENCVKLYLSVLLANAKAENTIAGCGYCKDTNLKRQFFEEAQVDPAQWEEFYGLFLRRKVQSTIPGWAFCHGEECLNGAWFGDAELRYFECSLCLFKGCLECGKDHLGCWSNNKALLEMLLAKGRLRRPQYPATDPDDPHFYDGKYRPCAHCGVLVERIDGCNTMKCPMCEKRWHWNKGLGGELHTFDNGEREYEPLVPAHL